MKLVLFDVDNTLLQTFEYQAKAYETMFPAVFGINAKLTDIKFGGPGMMAEEILREIARKYKVPDRVINNKLEDAQTALARVLESILPISPELHLLPGVPEVLSVLRQDYALGVLSGNPRRIAELLLKWAGIDIFFPVSCFGDEGPTRSKLIECCIAQYEAEQMEDTPKSHVALVGDSINDMKSARSVGVIAIGVATGFHSSSELKSNGADFVLSALTELPVLLAQI